MRRAPDQRKEGERSRRGKAVLRQRAVPRNRAMLETLETRVLLADAGGLFAGAVDTSLGIGVTQYVRNETLGDGPMGLADVDLYSFTAPKGKTIGIGTERQVGVGTDTDTYIRLFDSAGNELASNDDFPGSKHSQLNYYLVTGGTYYVGISGFGNTTYNPVTGAGAQAGASGSYLLGMGLLDVDAGDTLANPVFTFQGPNVANASWVESIGNGANGPRDVDVYKFRAAAGDQIKLTTSLPAGGDAFSSMLRLFNSAGQEIAASSETSGYATLNVVSWALDDYYVAISGRPNAGYDINVVGSGVDGQAGDYRLSLVINPPLSDVGDSMATARMKELLPGQVSVSADQNVIANGAHARKDVDMYAFVVADGDSVRFVGSLPTGGTPMPMVMRLFDAAGNQLTSVTGTTSAYPEIPAWFFQNAGTYYLGVSSAPNTGYDPQVAGSGVDGATGTYDVYFYLTPAPDWGTLRPDAKVTGLTAATPFAQAYERVGNFYEPTTDADLFRFEAAKGLTLTATTNLAFAGEAETDTLLRLFDVLGNEVARADNRPGSLFSTLKYTVMQGGTYYLGVSGAGNGGYSIITGAGTAPGATGKYRLDMTLGLTDVGDAIAGAEATGLGTLLTSTFVNESIGNGSQLAKDVDLYVLSGTAGQVLSAVTSLPSGGTTMSTGVRIFDAAGVELTGSSNAGGYGAAYLVLPATGTYYIGVSGLPNLAYDATVEGSGVNSASLGDYRLDVALANAPADAGDRLADAFATDIVPGVPGTFGHEDLIGNGAHSTKDVDLYRFEVADGQLVNLVTMLPAGGAPAALVLRLFNSAGVEILSATGTASSYPTLTNIRLFTGGTYYLGVSGAPNTAYDPALVNSGIAGATASYLISINSSVSPDAGGTLATAMATGLALSHVPFTQAYENLSNGGANDVDVYSFSASAGATLLAQTLNPGGGVSDANTVIRLFDSTGVELAFNDDGAGTVYSTLQHTFLASGTYYIAVSGSGNSTYNVVDGSGRTAGALGAYQLKLSLDVGETMSGAQPTIASGDFAVTGKIGDGPHGLKDVDLYTFTASAGAHLHVETSTPGGGTATAVAVRLFDASGNELLLSAPPAGYGTLNLILPATGTYYLGISGSPNTTYLPGTAGSGADADFAGDYTLSLHLSPPPPDAGDSLGSATTVALSAGVGGYVIRGDVIGNGAFARKDVDIICLVVGEGDVLSTAALMTTNGANIALSLKLLNSAGQVLTSTTGSTNDYPEIPAYLFVQAGTYYLAVSAADNAGYDPQTAGSGVDGATGTYELYIEITAPPDAGGTIATAVQTTLALNSPWARTFEKLGDVSAGLGDIDLYRFTSTGTQTLRVRTLNPYGVSADSDTVIRLFDATGNSLAINDNFEGSVLAELAYPIAAAGVYYIGITGAGNVSYNPNNGVGGTDGATGSYRLEMELDPGEPGDRISHAEVLNVGPAPASGQATGAIGDGLYDGMDVDMFKIRAGVGDQLTLVASLPSGGTAMDVGVRIFDSSGIEVARSEWSSGYGTLNVIFTRLDDYFVSVSALPNMGYDPNVPGTGVTAPSGDYQLGLTLIAAPADVSDTLAGALDSGILANRTGIYGNRNPIGNGANAPKDVDLFKLQGGEGDFLSISLAPYAGGTNAPLVLRLFNSAGAEIASAAGTAGTYPSLLNLFLTSEQTYYIGVSGAGNGAYDPAVAGSGVAGASGTYDLNVTLTPSPDIGDNRADSQDTGLALGTPYVRGFERVGNQYVGGLDIDLYKFSAAQGTSLHVRTLNAFGGAGQTDTVIRLFHSSGEELIRSDNAPGTLFSELTFNFHFTGTYYIGVSGLGNTSYSMFTGTPTANGATGSYRLEMELLPALEAGDSLASAEVTQTGPGTSSFSYTEALGNGAFGLKDVDLYAFTGGAGEKVDIFTSLPAGGTAGNTVVRLFAEFGQELAASTNASGYASLNYILPWLGKYYVGISAVDNRYYNPWVAGSGVDAGTGDYQVTINLTNALPDSGDTMATAKPTDLTGAVFGQFNHSEAVGNGSYASQDVDLYRMDLVEGAVVNIWSEAVSGGVATRVVLRLFDSSGTELMTVTSPDVGVYPSLPSYLVPQTGTYYVGVSGYLNFTYDPAAAPSGPGGMTGSYRLRIDALPSNDVGGTYADAKITALSPGSAGYVRAFERLGDTPPGSSDIDLYKFDALAGQSLRARTLNPFGMAAQTDTVIRLFNGQGVQIASNDNAPGTLYSLLDYVFTVPGAYWIGVSGAGNTAYNPVSGAGTVAGATGTYRLELALDVGDSLAVAMPTAGPTPSSFVIEGRIGDGANGLKDVDIYKLDGFWNGVVTISVTPGNVTPAEPQNTLVRFFNANGSLLWADDGGGSGSYINTGFVLPTSGLFYLAVSGLGNSTYNPNVAGSGVNGLAGAYRLSIQVAEPADQGHLTSTATEVALGPGLGTVNTGGVLGNGPLVTKDVDLFRFQGTAGQQIVARTSKPAGSLKPVDTLLALFDSAGHRLATAADISAENTYSELLFLLPTTGTYYIGVSGDPNVDYSVTDATGLTFGETGDYDLSLTLQYSGAIEGSVWIDRNGNGVRETTEGGLSGWKVYADLNNDGALSQGEPESDTDSTGKYRIGGLQAGSYLVREVAQSNWSVTLPASSSHTVNLNAGQTVSGKDFANRPMLSSVVMSVWQDFDSDGIRDATEPPFAGLTVLLRDPVNGFAGDGDDVTVAVALTGSDGRVAFDNINPGDYYAQVLEPDNFAFSPRDIGADETLDSDVSTDAGRTDIFTAVAQGTIELTAGLAAQADIVGTEGDDTLYLRVNSAGDLVQVFLGDQPVGDPAFSFDRASLQALNITTGGGDDTLIIDMSQGNPVPTGGLLFNSDGEGALGDSLVIRGDHSSGSYTPNPWFLGGGSISSNGRAITFTGVDALTIRDFSFFSYVAPSPDDQLTIDTPAAGVSRISGTSGGVPLTPVDFTSINQFIVDLAANDFGWGNDTFTIGPAGVGLSGLTSFSVKAGAGVNTLVFNGGNTTLNPSVAGNGTLAIQAHGAAIVNIVQALDLAALYIQDSARVIVGGTTLKTLRVSDLQIGPAGRLDLGQNDLILRTPMGQANWVAQQLQPLLQSGRNNGTWNGPGITSGAAWADPNNATGLAMISNDAGNSTPVFSSFGGFIVGPDAVLIKYTYEGDFDFSGRVDIDDYFRIDIGYARSQTGFAGGDITYDGAIGADDYFAIDRSFLGQTTALTRGQVSINASGWTDVIPARDTRKIYVSNSTGDDNNDGLTPATAVKTLDKGYSLLRNDMPDWLLLKRGDTWVGESFASFSKGGRSEHEIMVVGAYGSGDRPRIQFAGPSPAVSIRSDGDVSHLAIIGIHFEGLGETPGAGLDRTTAGDNFLIEDSVFEKFSTGMAIQGYYSTIHNFVLRRSQINDNFPVSGHAQGMYMNQVSGILIEENVFDHNGWRNPDRSDATIYNHNIYLASNNDGVIVRRNLISNASSHGLQARPGGIIEDNVFVHNPIGMSFGLVNGATLTVGGVSGRITGNLFLEATDIRSNTQRGWAIELSNLKYGGGTLVANNIFAHDQSLGTYAAIQLSVPSGATNPWDAVGIRDLTLENNIVYDWEAALNFSNRLIPGAGGYDGYSGLLFRNNDFQTHVDAFYLLTHYTDYSPFYETWSGNTYSAPMNMENWFRLGTDSISFAEWFNMVENDAVAGVRSYVDPNRSVGTYAASIGLAGSLDAFLAAAKSQSSTNWNANLAVDGILQHIRSGFVATGLSDVPLQHGLDAIYYDQPDFTTPMVFQKDNQLDFTFYQRPAEDMGVDQYSIQWEGVIEPPQTDTYTFYATNNDGMRVWIDGKLIIDDWNTGPQGKTTSSQGTIALEAGKRHHIGVQMWNGPALGIAKLEWSTPTLARQVVPNAHLYVKPPPTPAKKMIVVGDDVTEGAAGSATWRYWLDKQLEYGGYSVDFVGSRTGVASGSPAYGNFDSQHNAYSGYRADELIYSLGTEASNAHLALVHAGTQDLLQSQDPASTAADLGLIIDQLRYFSPNVTILLAQIAPAAGIELAAAELNSLLVALAASKTTPGSPVILVDQYTGFSVASDTLDGLRPSVSGEQKMSRNWYAAIQSALAPAGTPAAPVLLSATPISGNRVDLYWTDDSKNEKGWIIQRRLPAGAWADIATVAANATGYSDTTTLPSTSYEYRVIAFNDAGSAAPSPVAAVTTTNLTFYRGINLGGSALTIDGNLWQGSDATDYSFVGSTFQITSVTYDILTPASPQFTAMLFDGVRLGTGTNVTVSNVPTGTYLVKLYHFEDSASLAFGVNIEGQNVVPFFFTGDPGTWTQLGPFTVNIADGDIHVQFTSGEANLAGIEIWKVN